jgi:serine/threonine protein kinase
VRGSVRGGRGGRGGGLSCAGRAQLHYATEMAKALAELQRAGILHCDIKPCNVLLETGAARAKALRPKFGRRAHDTRPAPDAGLGHRLKVIDFGEGNPPEKAAGFVAGTPAYQAPEVAEDGACSFKSDMYSAGVSIVEVWTGQVRPAPPCLLLVKRLPRKAYLQALA